MSVERMLAWQEIKEHKTIYAVIIIVIALTMSSFMLETAYQNYMMQIVNGTMQMITSDAIVVNTDCTDRDLYGSETKIENAGVIAEDIRRALPDYDVGVRVTAQGTYGIGLAGEAPDGCTIQGIDIENDPMLSDIKSKIVEGRFFEEFDPILRGHKPLYVDLSSITSLLGMADLAYGTGQYPPYKDEPYPVIVGESAVRIHPNIVDVGKVLNVTMCMTARGTQYATVTVKIIGIYSSGTPTLDAMVWYMPDDSLREVKGYGESKYGMVGIPGLIQGSFGPIEIDRNIGDVVIIKAPDVHELSLAQIDPIGHSKEIAATIQDVVPDMSVHTWHDLLVFASGYMQDVVTLILWSNMIITLILAAAAIKYVMDSIVLRKTREIGSLKALGARDRVIFRIFLYQGLFIGVLAGILALALAILAMNGVNYFGLESGFIMGTQLDIEFIVTGLSILITLAVPIIISVIAASIPAKRASVLAPVEAIRKGELGL